MTSRLHIDRTTCDGRGLCAELLPELLTSDDWGYPMARGSLGVPEEMNQAARRAVNRCPTLALRLLSSP